MAFTHLLVSALRNREQLLECQLVAVPTDVVHGSLALFPTLLRLAPQTLQLAPHTVALLHQVLPRAPRLTYLPFEIVDLDLLRVDLFSQSPRLKRVSFLAPRQRGEVRVHFLFVRVTVERRGALNNTVDSRDSPRLIRSEPERAARA